MKQNNTEFGRVGEDAAVEFLKGRDYQIIERNYRLRSSEVDIIAYDKDTLCFIEVKTREDPLDAEPLEAITSLKQRKLSLAATHYLVNNKLLNCPARFDVVVVIMNTSGNYDINLLQNAFESVF